MRVTKAVTSPGHSDLVAETLLCFPNANPLVLFLLTAEWKKRKAEVLSLLALVNKRREVSEPQLAWEEDK